MSVILLNSGSFYRLQFMEYLLIRQRRRHLLSTKTINLIGRMKLSNSRLEVCTHLLVYAELEEWFNIILGCKNSLSYGIVPY